MIIDTPTWLTSASSGISRKGQRISCSHGCLQLSTVHQLISGDVNAMKAELEIITCQTDIVNLEPGRRRLQHKRTIWKQLVSNWQQGQDISQTPTNSTWQMWLDVQFYPTTSWIHLAPKNASLEQIIFSRPTRKPYATLWHSAPNSSLNLEVKYTQCPLILMTPCINWIDDQMAITGTPIYKAKAT